MRSEIERVFPHHGERQGPVIISGSYYLELRSNHSTTMYTIHQKQKLLISPEKAWDFFSDPGNLKVITPPYMGFDIVSGSERKMFPGQIIEYSVSPIANIQTKWVTEITHVIENEYFVDEQRIGPYSFWHHKHFIHPISGGVEAEDRVDYQLPLGILGNIMHRIMVKKKLNKIFSYRKNKLTSLFGSYKHE